jgi:predicted nucleotidyltransferase
MINLLERNRKAIEELCEEYQVQRLEVFGSAADDTFRPQVSDVDFIVEYEPEADLGPWLARHFELRQKLAELLGRSVDLVMSTAPGFRNPFFAREAERTRRLLYAA